MKYYILFGPPGAGKGTQASAMVERYNLFHVSTGALLRKEIESGSELGKQADALISNGNLVSDQMVEAMIEKTFNEDHNVDGFLLDGFPRTIEQAKDLDKLLANRGEEITSVVSIIIPDDLIFERIKHRAGIEHRADDADPEIIRNRIKTYHQKTEALIQYYTQSGKYHQVNGEGSIEDVQKRCFDLMDKF